MSGRQAAVWAGLLIVGLGCNNLGERGEFSPQPSPMPASGTLVVAGPATVPPGQGVQFTATLVEPSGARRDVTREARWSQRGIGLSVDATGFVSAHGEGFAIILATFGGTSTEVEIAAVHPGTFVVRGLVTPLIPVAPATIEILDGPYAGRRTTTGTVGEYYLAGVKGPMRLRASMLGQRDEIRAVSVDADRVEHFALQAPAVPDLTGRWTLLVTPDAACGEGRPTATAAFELAHNAGNTWRITWAAEAYRGPFWATLNSALFETQFGSGDDFEGYVPIQLSHRFGVSGKALGAVNGRHIAGTVRGWFGRLDSAFDGCEGHHRFEMRPAD
jgi:hypothetical protein